MPDAFEQSLFTHEVFGGAVRSSTSASVPVVCVAPEMFASIPDHAPVLHELQPQSAMLADQLLVARVEECEVGNQGCPTAVSVRRPVVAVVDQLCSSVGQFAHLLLHEQQSRTEIPAVILQPLRGLGRVCAGRLIALCSHLNRPPGQPRAGVWGHRASSYRVHDSSTHARRV
ncbi:hypothetical protein [Nocardia brasiliensis]|uniref:hypothetical protein n=1 Tax=Nocardia brasiliensis TaxID=37326 RepID=UPI0011DDF09B|nr:hypothetical protein [Nocardia brasiliensis]